MKNLFFALAFMLLGTFAFGINSEVETFENVSTVEESSMNVEMICGFDLSFDTDEGSGSFWMNCNDDTSMGDILNLILNLFW